MKQKLAIEALRVESFSVEPFLPVDGEVYAAPSYIDFTMCATNCSCPDTR